jgi:hypothetical protein
MIVGVLRQMIGQRAHVGVSFVFLYSTNDMPRAGIGK